MDLAGTTVEHSTALGFDPVEVQRPRGRGESPPRAQGVDPMGSKSNERSSPEFKFTVVLEVLKSEKPDAEVARAVNIHPATGTR